MRHANITWITDQIATGGDLSYDPDTASFQFAELLKMDLDLVIDCRIEDSDEELWETTDVDYLHLPVNDDYGSHLPASHFNRAVEAAKPVLDNGGKVFVHCHMGVNRGPSTAFALLLEQRVPAPRAFSLIRAKRPQAAVYYAMDALKAHLLRRGIDPRTKEGKRRITALRDHMDKVFTRKEWNAVQHVIRSNHEQDRRDLQLTR